MGGRKHHEAGGCGHPPLQKIVKKYHFDTDPFDLNISPKCLLKQLFHLFHKLCLWDYLLYDFAAVTFVL